MGHLRALRRVCLPNLQMRLNSLASESSPLFQLFMLGQKVAKRDDNPRVSSRRACEECTRSHLPPSIPVHPVLRL